MQQAAWAASAHTDRPAATVILQGLAKMAAEGTVRAFWRGNGTNVAKNIPEMVR